MKFFKLFTNNWWQIGFIFLILKTLCSCSGSKIYTEKKFKSSIVLDGLVKKDALIKHPKLTWVQSNYQKYSLDSATLNKISPWADSLSFLVFAGTWCSDTQRELPAFLKILDALKVGSNRYQIWMLDLKKQSQFINPSIFEVVYVPTFIVLKNGKEIGRIIEKPEQSLEKDLLNIIVNHQK